MTIEQRLRVQLREALERRDLLRVGVFRSALSAISNAEAVEAPSRRSASPVTGNGDVPRRTLSETDVRGVVEAEIAELHGAAGEYREHGMVERADILESQAAALEAELDGRSDG